MQNCDLIASLKSKLFSLKNPVSALWMLDCFEEIYVCWVDLILPGASFSLQVFQLPAFVCVHVCVSTFQTCLHDYSSPIQARITKFGPEVQNTLVKIPIILGMLDLNLQGEIYLSPNYLNVWFLHQSKYNHFYSSLQCFERRVCLVLRRLTVHF